MRQIASSNINWKMTSVLMSFSSLLRLILGPLLLSSALVWWPVNTHTMRIFTDNVLLLHKQCTDMGIGDRAALNDMNIAVYLVPFSARFSRHTMFVDY